MITVGTPLAGRYTGNGHETTDYTGVVVAVDTYPPKTDAILVVVEFFGGRQVTYITDADGNSVDTGMHATPCPTTHPIAPLHHTH